MIKMNPPSTVLVDERTLGTTKSSNHRLECPTPEVLDLCVRKRHHSPQPEGAHHYPYADHPVCGYSSPGSHDSENSDCSLSETYSHYNVSTDTHMQKPKVPRPFKAYPKDPLSLAVGVATAEAILGQSTADAYAQFRDRMLSQVQSQHSGTNVKMRRITNSHNNNNNDPTYWEKRKKNNEAAKRSRDARRAKEDEIAIRCAFLEQENLKLRYELATAKDESTRLRSFMYP